MYCFEIPKHTWSIIAYKILRLYFWESQPKIALWEYCIYALYIELLQYCYIA